MDGGWRGGLRLLANAALVAHFTNHPAACKSLCPTGQGEGTLDDRCGQFLFMVFYDTSFVSSLFFILRSLVKHFFISSFIKKSSVFIFSERFLKFEIEIDV